ncbi:MAG TPA: lipid droplet-associated protein [Mycobacteriales bacterium]|nr:lipid droplet-associated protein [Mycobacteriales bacterium]
MTPIPMPLRAAAGLAAVAIDEARRLPNRVVGLPVLAMGVALQASLKAQQRYAELVARGDQLLDQLRGTEPGTPAWARFDEDEAAGARPPSAFDAADPADGLADELAGEDELGDDVPADGRLTRIGPMPGADGLAGTDELAVDVVDGLADGDGDELVDAITVAADADADAPPLAGYDGMSIPQLRARLRTLTEGQLVDLIGYEQATAQRPAYLTMLENRLATVRGR